MIDNTVLSCIQPSGELHIGNYFGAIANWVALQNEYKCIYGVVDLHAMTMPYDPNMLRQNTEQMVIDLLACGIDPQKSILFVQSLVPEHTELCWILSCVCAYGDLTRQTQFKDKSEQVVDSSGDRFVSAGLFTYPVLQAADILIYRADFVPVGKDQEQHLELSREIARRFNFQFGEFFPEPKVLSTETPKIYSLADPTKKMSKSMGSKHYIGLFEDDKSIRAKVRAAITDSATNDVGTMSPGVASLFEILRACGKLDETVSLLKDYEGGGLQYRRLKETVADALIEMTGTFRSRKTELIRDIPGIMRQVYAMSASAREIAHETLVEVRRLTGLPSNR